MEYRRKWVAYDSTLHDIEEENESIDEMFECDMLHEVNFEEFLRDVSSNRMPGEYFTGLFIGDIDYGGIKNVFVTLTDNGYDPMSLKEIKDIKPGSKGRMKIVVEYMNDSYFVFKDKDGKYYYQKFY